MALLSDRKWKWSEVAQSCPTLCDPIDCSLPGSSIHGIFQATVLEWVAISFSRESSQPRDRTKSPALQADAFHLWVTRAAHKLGLILMGGAKLSKSLIQFSVNGRGCVPSLLFTRGQTMVRASLVTQRLNHLPPVWETWVWSLGREVPLEKEMATHSTIFTWRIPWTEDPGRLQSTGLQTVRHNWATSLTHSFKLWWR